MPADNNCDHVDESIASYHTYLLPDDAITDEPVEFANQILSDYGKEKVRKMVDRIEQGEDVHTVVGESMLDLVAPIKDKSQSALGSITLSDVDLGSEISIDQAAKECDISVGAIMERQEDGTYRQISETTFHPVKKMHGLLTCKGDDCFICKLIARDKQIDQFRAKTISHTKFRSLLAEYCDQLGRECSDKEVQDFAASIDLVNHDIAKNGDKMPGVIELGSNRQTFSKSQIGQALANQIRARRLAKKLKRKEKAAQNRCKGYDNN